LLQRIDALLASVNEWMKPFGYTMAVREPWDVAVNDTPSAYLSESQGFRAGLALAITIAHLTGVRWIMADRLDLLDRRHRETLFSVVQAALSKGYIEQAIAVGTVADPKTLETMSAPEGVAVWAIKGGKLERVG